MAVVQGMTKVNVFGEDLENQFENGCHLTLNVCFATYKKWVQSLKCALNHPFTLTMTLSIGPSSGCNTI